LKALALAKKVACFAFDKKAENIVVMDMREIVNYCDYFVICSGTGSRHVKAIADGIDGSLHDIGIKVKFKQGLDTAGRSRAFSLSNAENLGSDDMRGHWGLLDMGDVVTHIFEADSRDFYGLEHLWHGAVSIDWQK
jgi:ribosome-associated protein